jgi:hypothetical protein
MYPGRRRRTDRDKAGNALGAGHTLALRPVPGSRPLDMRERVVRFAVRATGLCPPSRAPLDA